MISNSYILATKKLDINKGAIVDFEEFLDKISPLKTANKLGTILIQLPPSFTVSDFKNIEFKEMISTFLSAEEKNVLEQAQSYLSKQHS